MTSVCAFIYLNAVHIKTQNRQGASGADFGAKPRVLVYARQCSCRSPLSERAALFRISVYNAPHDVFRHDKFVCETHSPAEPFQVVRAYRRRPELRPAAFGILVEVASARSHSVYDSLRDHRCFSASLHSASRKPIRMRVSVISSGRLTSMPSDASSSICSSSDILGSLSLRPRFL